MFRTTYAIFLRSFRFPPNLKKTREPVVLLVHREIGVGKPDHHPRLLLTSEADRHPRLLLTSEQPFFVQRVV